MSLCLSPHNLDLVPVALIQSVTTVTFLLFFMTKRVGLSPSIFNGQPTGSDTVGQYSEMVGQRLNIIEDGRHTHTHSVNSYGSVNVEGALYNHVVDL